MGFFVRLIVVAVVVAVLPACGDRRSGEGDDDGDGDTENDAANVFAIHNAETGQYRTDCLSCHSDILTEESLDSSIPTAHNAMLPETPGETNEDKCVYCHASVDLLQHSAGNIRRQVAVETCSLCHGPDGPSDVQFYQE